MAEIARRLAAIDRLSPRGATAALGRRRGAVLRATLRQMQAMVPPAWRRYDDVILQMVEDHIRADSRDCHQQLMCLGW